ncbi:MAG: SIR2 family NAD-dependent protein deacylase [Methylobacter sp.]
MELFESKFLHKYLQNPSHMMWFLGAGTSRSAGLPTAADIIWDLKHRYYCLHENQDIKKHDINNNAIKQKIQFYMDSKGFPEIWSPEEYSFYFDLLFSDDYSLQQKYIRKVLSNDKVSLNIGHRVLAALLEMHYARIVFTTNFDDVIETAFANVSSKNLPTFHLEGSYAALAELNAEQFPIYAKIHGDFRYQKIKNLTVDLLNNDQEIQKCFLAAATRYGLIVSGYSGRDMNVMTMFRKAIDQNNAFPHGLFWTTPKLSDVTQDVKELIEYAQSKNVSAYLTETGTFDEMLSKIWKQIKDKPPRLDEKVRAGHIATVNIPLPISSKQCPVLRTNALPIIMVPNRCGSVESNIGITFGDLKQKIIEKSPKAVLTYTDKVLFWGDENEITKVIPSNNIDEIKSFDFDNAALSISESTFLKSFFEQSLTEALCQGKPLLLRRKNKSYYAVVQKESEKDQLFSRLRAALGNTNQASIIGNVPKLIDVTWAECVSIRLEERDGKLWVMLKPDIWIKPLARRHEATDFLRQRRLKRWNKQAYQLLDAWIEILLGSVGSGSVVKVSCYPETKYCATFEIGTRTAYSGRDGYGR